MSRSNSTSSLTTSSDTTKRNSQSLSLGSVVQGNIIAYSPGKSSSISSLVGAGGHSTPLINNYQTKIQPKSPYGHYTNHAYSINIPANSAVGDATGKMPIYTSTSRPKQPASSYNQENSSIARVLSAVFYAIMSIMITIVNKRVLTNYNFPNSHFLALGQLSSTVVVLFTLKNIFKSIEFPSFSRQTLRRILPLPLFYMANLFGGLLSTKNLSLPMFTVLRRFSILMTMLGETYFLKKQQPVRIRFCVFIMILGSCVAASNDLAFNLYGYFCVTVNNFATAANGVCTKKKLDSKELGKFGILYYNALFTLPMAYFLVKTSHGGFDEVLAFEHWSNPMFTGQFILSCMMALLLNYSVVLCTHYNSALVTTVVGCIKNIVITYYGIIFPTHDYIFSWMNFTGVTVSVLGSVAFSWFSFASKESR